MKKKKVKVPKEKMKRGNRGRKPDGERKFKQKPKIKKSRSKNEG